MVIGVVVGGVLGNQIGGGKGKMFVMVVGVVGGGYVGKKIEQSCQYVNIILLVECCCSMVNNFSIKLVGYDVCYEYNGVVCIVCMDYDLGDCVQVQEGVIVVFDVC